MKKEASDECYDSGKEKSAVDACVSMIRNGSRCILTSRIVNIAESISTYLLRELDDLLRGPVFLQLRWFVYLDPLITFV